MAFLISLVNLAQYAWYGSVLLQSKARDLISHCAVGIEIAGTLHWLSGLIQCSLRRFSFDPFFIQTVFALNTSRI